MPDNDLIDVIMDVVNKEVSRLSQDEAGFKELSDGEKACASCRWFDGKSGGMCLLVQNYPADVTEKSVCERHETLEVKEVAETPEAVTAEPGESDPETPPVFTVTVADAQGKSLRQIVTERLDALFGRKEEELTSFKVQGNRFLITWSNNFRDRDGEIFTAKAIDDYVARVDSGIVPPPELVIWHLGSATRIGQADFVARHGHFLIAGGEFDATPGAEKAKRYYQRHARKTAVSHGFTFKASSFDGKHYHAFNTFEISLLPRGREANRYTSLDKVKEMTLTPEKQQYLAEIFGDEEAKAILADLDKKGKALEDLGAEFKDFLTPQDAEPEPEQAEADVKALVADLIRDNAQLADLLVGMANARKADKEAAEERANALQKSIDDLSALAASLKDTVESKPKAASTAEETELTAARLDAINKQADAQLKITDPFWHTTYTPNGNGA